MNLTEATAAENLAERRFDAAAGLLTTRRAALRRSKRQATREAFADAETEFDAALLALKRAQNRTRQVANALEVAEACARAALAPQQMEMFA